MALAISAAESASVPSQSKASNRKRRGGSSIGGLQSVQGVEKSAQFGWKRRLEVHRALFDRMGESDSARMEEHPLQALLGERLVPRKIAILFISCELEPEVGQMNPDLVRASGMKLRLQK